MDHILDVELELPLPIETVFAFFGEAANLERITPPELKFHIVTPQPIDIKKGTLIDYRIRMSGIPFSWRTLIAEWEPPFRFVDVQLKGPYSKWEHTHTFEATETGTRVRDRVVYRLPLSPLGDLAHFLIRRKLNAIFCYRTEAVTRILMEQNSCERIAVSAR
jgi:ligand-binding SRPBCC domain-containing protein